jgi:competence ComEA-like helix-hairpin-helix protein
MAQPDKIDLNLASREQLVAAGIRPALADAILKHRGAKGAFASVDALIEVAGIGAATLQQLKSVLMVAAQPAHEAPAAVEAAEPAPVPVVAEVVEAPVEIAPVEACTVAEPVVEAPLGEVVVAEAGPAAIVETVAQPVAAVVEAAVEPAATVVAASESAAAKPAGYATGGVPGLWLGLATEQLAHGVETWQALAAAKSWREAMHVQGAYLAASANRLIAVSQRSIKLTGKVVGSLAILGGRPARKAA